MTPVRVLQVVGLMHRGGVETWLMQLLRNADPARLHMDFMTNRCQDGDYDSEIRDRGSLVLQCPNPSRPLAFARSFITHVRAHGPYDAVHSHVHHYNGWVLALARYCGIPVRIAHSHLDTRHLDSEATLPRFAYLRMMRTLIRFCATRGIAASELAARALFGRTFARGGRCRVLHCGLDYSSSCAAADARAARFELGVPPNALLVGHVGRFAPQKNHEFLIRVAAEVVRLDPRAHFVLVGDGPLRRRIEMEVTRAHLHDRVRFTGVRPDVPTLLRAMDVFLLPSLHEGLPLVGLEAQAAAVPIVLANTITPELGVIPALLHWCSLDAHPAVWAERVLAAARAPRPISPDDAVKRLQLSDFSIRRNLVELEKEYASS